MSPEVRNDAGETPLLLAARYDHAQAARALLERGADVNARDKRGFTPLMRAVLNGSMETVQTITEFQPDLNAQTPDPDPNTSGSTALMYAVAKDRKDVLDMLLDAGADINESDVVVGPALTWAAAYDREEIAADLLERGADANVVNNGGGPRPRPEKARPRPAQTRGGCDRRQQRRRHAADRRGVEGQPASRPDAPRPRGRPALGDEGRQERRPSGGGDAPRRCPEGLAGGRGGEEEEAGRRRSDEVSACRRSKCVRV